MFATEMMDNLSGVHCLNMNSSYDQIWVILRNTFNKMVYYSWRDLWILGMFETFYVLTA